MNYRNVFVFFGLENPSKLSKYWICLHLLITSITYIFGILQPVNIPENFSMSYLVSLFVFTVTIISASVCLIETLRTSHIQVLLNKKLLDIDKMLWFLLRKEFSETTIKILMIHAAILTSCTLIFTTISIAMEVRGYFLFGVYFFWLNKLRTLQMILHLEGFYQKITFLNQCETFHEKATLSQVKRIYNLLIEINSLHNKCFECSLLSIVLCNTFDIITNVYWLILGFLGILHIKYCIVYTFTLLPLFIHAFSLSRLALVIRKEVSLIWNLF